MICPGLGGCTYVLENAYSCLEINVGLDLLRITIFDEAAACADWYRYISTHPDRIHEASQGHRYSDGDTSNFGEWLGHSSTTRATSALACKTRAGRAFQDLWDAR